LESLTHHHVRTIIFILLLCASLDLHSFSFQSVTGYAYAYCFIYVVDDFHVADLFIAMDPLWGEKGRGKPRKAAQCVEYKECGRC
jgi:hypothetical protein